MFRNSFLRYQWGRPCVFPLIDIFGAQYKFPVRCSGRVFSLIYALPKLRRPAFAVLKPLRRYALKWPLFDVPATTTAK